MIKNHVSVLKMTIADKANYLTVDAKLPGKINVSISHAVKCN